MGEIFIGGKDAASFLDYALVGAASEIAVGRAKYSLICNEAGGILDDLIVYRLAETSFLVVANASNKDVVFQAFKARLAGFDTEVRDESDSWVLLAIQGPKSVEILSTITSAPLSELRYYAISEAKIADVDCLLARTGYTGEDGFEIYIPVAAAEKVFDALMAAGSKFDLMPTGLACRDTLRLEAGMPLYGHEMNEDVNPYQAGFGKVVRLDKPGDFVGKDALQKLSESKPTRVLVGLIGEGKRAARADYEIFTEGSETAIGVVTSGALSPTLGYPVAMGFLNSDLAAVGSKVSVDVRGTRLAFEVVRLPFYKR
jgi:aminomethyltransferase